MSNRKGPGLRIGALSLFPEAEVCQFSWRTIRQAQTILMDSMHEPAPEKAFVFLVAFLQNTGTEFRECF